MGRSRYIDVDVGTVSVDEREVLARTLRTHPTHQPFRQPVGGPLAPIALDASFIYDGSRDKHPLLALRTPPRMTDDDPLPNVDNRIWLNSSPVPTELFSLGILSGPARPGYESS